MMKAISIKFEENKLSQLLCEIEMTDPQVIAKMDAVSEAQTKESRARVVQKIIDELSAGEKR